MSSIYARIAQHSFFLVAAGICFLISACFFLQPLPALAITCSECATSYGEDLGFCATQEEICLDEFEDPEDCSSRRASCEEPFRDVFNRCLSQCEEPTPESTAPEPETPPASNPPAASGPVNLTSPSFDKLLSEGILKANISEPCKKLGSCQITDMIQIVLNVMTFILGISGSVFLLIFVWGGFLWLTSAGDSGKFKQGLDTLRDAVIGLIVVFAAYTIVNSALSLIRTGTLPTESLNDTVNDVTEVDTIQLK